MGLIEILGAEPHDPDIIRACVGPGMSPAATTPYAPRHPNIRAIGQGRFVLNELVRRLSLKTEPVAAALNSAATLRT